MYGRGSPDRPNRSKAAGMMNKYSPQKNANHQSQGQKPSLKDRYVKQGSPTRTNQDQQFTEAKRILDQHINFLSRGCYYYFRDAIGRFDADAMALVRTYRNHENSDQLVTAMTEHYNDSESVSRSVGNNSRSPVR